MWSPMTGARKTACCTARWKIPASLPCSRIWHSPAERAVAITYSTQRMTWAQASALGNDDDPDTFGNRVRRG